MVKLKEDYWEVLIKECEGSGLSQSYFCQKKGIPVAQYRYRWRRAMVLNNKSELIESKRIVSVPFIYIVALLISANQLIR